MRKAAQLIAKADALLIGAGAGMGVDSGLPDFRGDEGFWNAYPQLAKLKLSFTDVANPRGFLRDPARAWGFYGHRFNLYRSVVLHFGFNILKHWISEAPYGGYVYTSNVDGSFGRAGIDNVVECHGSINHWQCSKPCNTAIYAAPNKGLAINEHLRLAGDVPVCSECGDVARPNILMFGDSQWLAQRTQLQYDKYREWLASVANKNLVILEIGAGTAVPSVRSECEHIDGQLIRINPLEYKVSRRGGIGLSGGALEMLTELENIIRDLK